MCICMYWYVYIRVYVYHVCISYITMYILFILLNFHSLNRTSNKNIINTSPRTNYVYKQNFFPDRLFN